MEARGSSAVFWGLLIYDDAMGLSAVKWFRSGEKGRWRLHWQQGTFNRVFVFHLVRQGQAGWIPALTTGVRFIHHYQPVVKTRRHPFRLHPVPTISRWHYETYGLRASFQTIFSEQNLFGAVHISSAFGQPERP
jgi:hypothetical protein